MRYELKPINQENWRTVAKLQVAPHQEEMIEANSLSLLEAAYDVRMNWSPIALYVDKRIVGFAMIGAEDKENHSIWFDRFMIDQKKQHQGYGHALFKSVLNYLHDNFHVEKVYLSVHPENEKAFPFYESFGFTALKVRDPHNGQKIMELTIDR
ncbi:MAG TPA: GNAT family N-acetyltransferase [Candidatus Tetragenococcus pullicola]|nr:GNAT family N-acetyltransferase [Candidatus Tetragenococcus pullicola]